MNELAARAACGDRGAFDLLYHEHVDRVHALCLWLSADRRQAEELTQDVFVRTWEKLGTFRGESRFSTWLYRLAVNVVIEDRRSRKREADRRASPGRLALLEGGSRVGRHDARMDLERSVAALPDGARTVLVLHDIEGYRYEEVAEMVGIAVGTVKSQLHRARRLLREMLDR